MNRAQLALIPLILLAQIAIGGEATPQAISGLLGADGVLAVSADGNSLCSFNPGLFEKGWKQAGSSPAKGTFDDKLQHFVMRTSTGAVVDGVLSCSQTADKAGVSFWCAFTPQADIELNTLHVSVDFPVAALAGGKWTADDQNGVFPAEFKDISLHNAATKSLKLGLPNGSAMLFEFKEPTQVLLQDNRKWGPAFSIRIGYQWDGRLVKKGEKQELKFTVSTTPRMTFDIDAPVTIKAGPEWIPLTLEQDIEPGSALDFSALGFQDAPAGKHGRVIATQDGHFAFEDSPKVSRRFYGINLCFSAQFLTHEQADKLAERLMRLGYNAVRFHHYEGELTEGQPDSTQLNPQKLDQWDYLFAALKTRGLYVTTDLFVSRPVKWKDIGIDKPGNVPMDTFKILIPVLPAAYENWKAFSKSLLDHVNPYTKLRYADDPALAWLSMINEGNFGNFQGELRNIPEWNKAWNAWLRKQYQYTGPAGGAHLGASIEESWGKELKADEDPAKENVALPENIYDENIRVGDCALFHTNIERDMIKRMKDFLHNGVGCKALITNSNSWTNFICGEAAREDYDYVDDHFYVDHPQFLEKPWNLPSRCSNLSPITGGATGGRNCAFTRLFGKPFTITEFNYAAPGRFRGVGGILTGALGALQGWDGIWRFAYSHSREGMFAPGRMDYFNMANDPLGQAAERASLCLFVRGDMQPTPHFMGLDLGLELERPAGPMPRLAPRWNWAAWIARVGYLLTRNYGMPDAPPQPGSLVMMHDASDAEIMAEIRPPGRNELLSKDAFTDPAKPTLRSETGEAVINGPNNTLLIDTPKTAGGYAPAGSIVATVDGRLSIAMLESDATVWLSSLDDKPLTESSRILLTHLTDLQNTDIHYAEKARKTLLDWGKLPQLVRAGKAAVTLKRADADKLKVWALSTGGKRLFEVKVAATDGAAVFTVDVADHAGESGAHICYEISK